MRSFPQRVYVDLFAACGICEDTMTGERSWGTAPVALQVATPFDVYFFNDNDAELADALAEGVERIGVQGASVLKLDLREDGALHHARDLGKVVVPFGRKIIVATGDANEAHHALKQILEPGRRYVCAGTSPAPGSLRHGALAPLLPPDQLSLARMNAGL